MKSFKFTGISICFISHRLADNPTCGEGQRLVLKHEENLEEAKSRLTGRGGPRVKKNKVTDDEEDNIKVWRREGGGVTFKKS